MAAARSPAAQRHSARPAAGAHVRAGLEDAPEVAGIALEGLRPKRPFPGGDAGLVMTPRLGEGLRRFLRQQHMSVGAKVGDLQRPFGQCDPFAFGARVPGLVHELLGLPKHRVIAFVKPGGQPAGEPGHHPLQGPAVGQRGRRHGVGHRLGGRLFPGEGRGLFPVLAAVLADRHGDLAQVSKESARLVEKGCNALVFLQRDARILYYRS